MDCHADKSARNDRKMADTNTSTARNDKAAEAMDCHATANAVSRNDDKTPLVKKWILANRL